MQRTPSANRHFPHVLGPRGRIGPRLPGRVGWTAHGLVSACLLALALVPACGAAPNAARLEAWRAARFGLFIHWGPVTLRGTELSWSRGREVPTAEYDLLYQQFNPVNFAPDGWARLAREAGMKYLVFTTKHHDGFCEFDTAQTEYSIMHTPLARDVVGELAAACQRQGVLFGTYYSVNDWVNPNYPYTGHNMPRDTYDLDAYTVYFKAQLSELITHYGPLEVMWFDASRGFDAAHGQEVVDYVRSLQPDIIINDRCSNPGDYTTPEQKVGTFQMSPPWESCITMGTQWSWKPNDTIKSLAECLRLLIRCAGGDGNLLLNVGPNALGDIEPLQAQRLRDMGQWLSQYGQSIYATRGGPFKPNNSLVSTRRGNVIYLHLLVPAEHVWLPPLPCHVLSASVLTGGTVQVSQSSTRIMLDVGPAQANDADVLVQLNLDADAMGLDPIAVPDLTVGLSPTSPRTTTDLMAQAAGGIGTATYAYEWARLPAGGGVWDAWGHPGPTLDQNLTAKGDQWKARARATDGADYSDWSESAPLTILNSTPRFPTKATVSPSAPDTDDDLRATAAGATDADGDPLTYSYEWRQSVDGGTIWSAWGNAGPLLDHGLTNKGDKWQARSRASDGTAASAWWESPPVTISAAAPVPPTLVSATYVDPTHVDVLFSKSLGRASAETVGNYSIPYLTVNAAALQADGKTVRLATTAQPPGRTFTAFVSRVRDPGGNAMPRTAQTSWTTPAVVLTLVSATYVDTTHVEVLFSEEVVRASAEATGNYSVPYLTVSAAALRADGKTVRLTTTAQASSRTFTVFVSGVQDRADNPMPRTGKASWTTPTVSLTVAGATYADPTHVDVLFSDLVLQASAETAGNYSVPYLTVSAPTLQPDGKTVRLTTTTQPPSRAFTVFVSNVQDQAGNRMPRTGKASWTTPATVNPAGGPLALTSLTAAPTRSGGAELRLALTGAAVVEVVVLNLAGREVGVVCRNEACAAGPQVLGWNGCRRTATRLPDGCYLLRVTARDAAGEQAVGLCPLQLRR